MDTIFALSSGHIKSGVAVFRISGAETLKIATSLTQKVLKPRHATFCKFIDPATNSQIDSGIAIWFPAPFSFTGEDCLELHCHGSLAVIKFMIEVLSKFQNVRLAVPGEFTRRSFLNGKMDLTEIEGLSDLLASETDLQRKQAIAQSSGMLRQKADVWRAELLRVMALLEASIDFSDQEDISDAIIGKVILDLKSIAQQWEVGLKQSPYSERLRDGFTVVLTGEPNVGKSSLINAIAGRDVAIISTIPGTTRDLIEVNVDVDGLPIKFVDTAGLRATIDELEQEGIRRATEAILNADIILHLFHPSKDYALGELSHLDLDDKIIIPVATHADILTTNFEHSISATTGTGIDRLLDCIHQKLMNADYEPELAFITRKRHVECFQGAYNALCNALNFDFNSAPELAAEALRESALHLSRLSGEIMVDDLLEYIFREFCIGK